MGLFLFLCLLILLQSSAIQAALFTSTNTYISTSFITLYTNTSNIDIPAANGTNTQKNDRNIIQCNNVTPPESGLEGILYDRGTSCQLNTTDIIPPLLTDQPKIALVQAGGECNLTEKAWFSALDGAQAVVAYGAFDQGVYTDTTISVENYINITVYYVDINIGKQVLQLLRQPQPVSLDPASNVSYQTALKITLYPAVGGFPNAWEFTLLIVMSLFLVSILISVGIHWHLWRVRRRQRMYDDHGMSLVTMAGRPQANKHVIDPAYLPHFPTRIIGQLDTTKPVDQADHQDIGRTPVPNRPLSALSIRTERALENAEALAATIVHPRKLAEAETLATDQPTASLASLHHSIASGQQEDACVICLDDFTQGDTVRKLPCGHEYHCECIDPWLTIKSASCPLCKHDCAIHVVVDDQDPLERPEPAVDRPRRMTNQSGFSLSLRRRMDQGMSAPRRAPSSTVSSFGPTFSIEEAEAFSQSWMARSLPRNMRRQIRQAIQEAHLAQQQQEEPAMQLPARMMQSPTDASPDPALPHGNHTSIPIDPPSTSSRRFFPSLPRQWRS